jgi:surfeit locus 1 family protein
MAADYRFLRSPRWIAGIVIAVLAVVTFVNLGLWQLRRLDDRRTANVLIEAGMTAEPSELSALLREESDPAALAFRRVRASGVYLVDEEVILQVRSLNGQSGHEVLTPLLLDDGTVVIVDRGWVTIDVAGPPVVGSEPPSPEVTVGGVLRESQEKGRFGPSDAASGRLERISRVDLNRLQQQFDQPLLPVYLRLETQAPAQSGRYPIALPPAGVSEGPHLSYAMQWFIFATIVAIGFPVLVRRTGRTPVEPKSDSSA